MYRLELRMIIMYSVECVKRHKVEFVCSGRRCKSSFVKLSNFNDNQLHSGL